MIDLGNKKKRNHMYENEQAYYLEWQREVQKFRIENIKAEEWHNFKQIRMYNEYVKRNGTAININTQNYRIDF